MVTAVVESPLRQRQRLRSSPLAGGGITGSEGDLVEFARRRASGSGGGMRGRWAPPEIEIPTNNGLVVDTAGGGGGGGLRGYTSLRDIMSSPEYAAAAGKAANSPDEPPAGGAVVGGADVHMIRHPLVKHAAYAYLQLTPSAREAEARRRMLLQRRRGGGGGPLCRLFLGCLGFLAALFGCDDR